jgi:hypothetical protein
MVLNIMENGLMINKRVKEEKFGAMELFMKENISKD